MANIEQKIKDQNRYRRPVTDSKMYPAVNEPRINLHPVRFEPMESFAQSSVGQDLWRQLKRVEIPVFSGIKRAYQRWKAAFLVKIKQNPRNADEDKLN